MEDSSTKASPRAVGIFAVVSHTPARGSLFNVGFYHPTAYRRSTSLGPCFSHQTPARVVFRLFCVLRPSRFSSMFFEAFHLQQPSLTFKVRADSTSNCALLFQLVFSLLWLPKGAHPHLQELFLRPRSIRRTSTLLRHPNLHPFCLLPRPVMPLLAFHMHLDPRFMILAPLIIFLVIRVFFISLLLHHLYPLLL